MFVFTYLWGFKAFIRKDMYFFKVFHIRIAAPNVPCGDGHICLFTGQNDRQAI